MVQGYIDPRFPNPMAAGDASIIIYGYIPSQILGILGATLFACLFVLHSIQVLKYRFWSFSVISIACVVEIIGYAFRILSSRIDPYRIAFFVGQYFCITCAPVLISAGIYVFLTEFLLWALEAGFHVMSIKHHSLTPSHLLWTFIGSDVVCTLLQVTGASLIGNRTSKQQDPTSVNRILIAGLAVQLVSFLLFLCLLIAIMVACSRSARSDKELRSRWKGKQPACLAVLAAALLVFLRTAFRLAESVDGVFGYLSSHEIFFGVLEFAPIVMSLVLLSVWHPGKTFPRYRSSNNIAKV